MGFPGRLTTDLLRHHPEQFVGCLHGGVDEAGHVAAGGDSVVSVIFFLDILHKLVMLLQLLLLLLLLLLLFKFLFPLLFLLADWTLLAECKLRLRLRLTGLMLRRELL